jgi:hypothetical protein
MARVPFNILSPTKGHWHGAWHLVDVHQEACWCSANHPGWVNPISENECFNPLPLSQSEGEFVPLGMLWKAVNKSSVCQIYMSVPKTTLRPVAAVSMPIPDPHAVTNHKAKNMGRGEKWPKHCMHIWTKEIKKKKAKNIDLADHSVGQRRELSPSLFWVYPWCTRMQPLYLYTGYTCSYLP